MGWGGNGGSALHKQYQAIDHTLSPPLIFKPVTDFLFPSIISFKCTIEIKKNRNSQASTLILTVIESPGRRDPT